jgi:hypothetical protein
MDSARFIRKKSVFALWIGTPLLLIFLVDISSHSFKERMQIRYSQFLTQKELIPEMETALERFDQFAADYQSTQGLGKTVETDTLALVTQAAEKARFGLMSINLTQKNVGNAGVQKITLHVEGKGKGYELASFLNNIRIEDPLLHEEHLQLSLSGAQDKEFNLKLLLYKIYKDQEAAE